jgi:POTRA domain-containing FtsQ-type protein/cell division protein FtsQ
LDLMRPRSRGPLREDAEPQAASPFLRQSQDERMRRTRRGRRSRVVLPAALGLFAVAALTGLVFGTRWFLLHSGRFNIAKTDVTRTEHASYAELKRLADRARGRNIFTLDLAKLQGDLEKVRWVKSAVVRRVLPDRLMVGVEERAPHGLALVKGRVSLIDEDGAAIDLYTGTKDFGTFPIFTGLDDIRAAHARDQVTRGFDFVHYLEGSHPGFLAEISEIDLSRDDRIGLTLNNGGPTVRVHPTDYASNLDRWLEMRDWLQAHLGGGAYVDLRFKDRIVWQPVGAKRAGA